ncbi:velvet factor-domain-containing protein [Podospora australis]|uniref:Velvet factor-domain-containing protein n=1 Tax=Podospora australis TaxID=1536484 RepID=A0AAN6X1E8_9PEZI|nr:velvet factor-domain-containing protein [Podospora australis]
MSISNILSSDNTSNQPLPPPMASPQVASSIHRITVRQQPYAARSCGFGERDRRVIDPPPIVQLTIHDDSLSKSEVSQLLRHQFSVVHCSIWDDKGEKDMSSMPEDFRQQRRLMGTLVASPFVGLDENGEEGCFFCFPDLSCRTPGSFRLKFALVVLDPINMRTGTKSDILATVFSEPFQVYNAKDFPGMKASTQLTKRLKEQGCLISIKKGNEKRDTPGSSRGGTGKDDDDYDEDDSDEGSAKWPRKKARRSA